MGPEQIKLVQSSFAAVLPIADEAGKLFYERLFALTRHCARCSRVT